MAAILKINMLNSLAFVERILQTEKLTKENIVKKFTKNFFFWFFVSLEKEKKKKKKISGKENKNCL